MSVERRVIVAPDDQEEIAIVAIPLPAGGEIEIDRAWRFLGWQLGMEGIGAPVLRVLVGRPQRIDVAEAEGEP